MSRTRGKVHQIKTTWTDDEYAQLQALAKTRNVPLGVCVRGLVHDVFRTQLTRGETLLLEAVQELQANYLGVIRLQIDKRFSPSTFAAMTEQNRLRRRALAHEFLLTAPPLRETEDPDDEDE